MPPRKPAKITLLHPPDTCSCQAVLGALQAMINPEKAASFPRFFKSKPGEYGEDDLFLGITVPQQRLVAKQFGELPESDFALTLKFARRFLDHKHDLMHKATGWMLREISAVDEPALLEFLDSNVSRMPRTMLRYAIEKLTPAQRASNLER